MALELTTKSGVATKKEASEVEVVVAKDLHSREEHHC